MAVFPFDWRLSIANTRHRKKNCYISSLAINSEWSLECLWSQYDPYKPEFLEIRRNSKAQDILVSGTYELKSYAEILLQRRFTCLIEAGYTDTRIELEYSSSHRYDFYDKSGYSIIGTLNIPDGMPQQEKVKGAQFESLLNLSKDFECLLDPKVAYFTDVNLKCQAVSLPAHKNILSARSPVFAAMFASQMKENRDNKVDIADISPHILKTMLTYVYTGKTGDLTVQSASALLFAADKYQLQDLKRVCCGYLKSCVSSQNVLNTLVLGYLHDQNLKAFAISFICNSVEEFEVLEKTAEWKTLREKRPTLAMDVLTGLVKSKDEKLKGKKVEKGKIRHMF